jgi:hypothetical protein
MWGRNWTVAGSTMATAKEDAARRSACIHCGLTVWDARRDGKLIYCGEKGWECQDCDKKLKAARAD